MRYTCLVCLLQVHMKIEKKFREHNMAVIEKNTKYTTSQLERISREMKAALLKTLAYKEVIRTKTFSKIKDRNDRLNAKYTQYAMRFEIAEQIKKLDPMFLREQKARDQIERQRRAMNKLITRNLRTIQSPRARERKRLLRELNLNRGSTFGSLLESRQPTQTMTSRQNTKGVMVTKDSVKSRGKAEPVTLKLPPIDINNKSAAGKTRTTFTADVPKSPVAVRKFEPVIKQSTAGVKLPPIKLNTVR